MEFYPEKLEGREDKSVMYPPWYHRQTSFLWCELRDTAYKTNPRLSNYFTSAPSSEVESSPLLCWVFWTTLKYTLTEWDSLYVILTSSLQYCIYTHLKSWNLILLISDEWILFWWISFIDFWSWSDSYYLL